MTIHEPLMQAHVAKLTVKDFLTLADAGSFDRYSRCELIEGEIWVVNGVHLTHARLHAMMTIALGTAIQRGGLDLTLYSNLSVELATDSLPEPDIVVAGRADGRVLPGGEAILAVEVSVSTLDIDLGRKLRLYAKHAIPEYWVIDAEAALVRQFWLPDDGAYLKQRDTMLGEAIRAASIAGLIVETTR